MEMPGSQEAFVESSIFTDHATGEIVSAGQLY